MSFFRPIFIQSWLELYRKGGFKQLMKEKGFKVILLFTLFYLIRDSIIYIIIPYFAYKSVF
ncbi:MAG: hypothetical protein HN657_00610 [Candidatus Marinimicrobia bacterium]|jgi:hypothetical protein|nr:hypothetical protein [Candidatus Neomarinimicrobiota bacterium]MBT3496467.1 hypothetical protein [Candidatus Neomarinimicrobiota bacterium]MBT3692164.1 hypothetical protein [Candidatus Neomarinimicrobiota bacterium]MBT3732653.1 hypothetical protein [Candidatus Neomarinimicrobiota bacterium]MBT4144459.1 hypothetical protein [Candidatus Neomarinimicrobiota bacterium]